MREVFKNELNALADDLVTMTTQAAEAVEKASRALQTNDLDLAEAVIDGDAVIDNLQHHIDQQAAQILTRVVLAQPAEPVPDPPVRQHRLEPEAEIACIAVTQHIHPARIGGQNPADPC